ncbi:MAG: hypothetical protein ACRDND_12975, partial [Streptosporangiaceae bacterium]
YTLNGLAGEYFHPRGVARRPGGWKLASYNVPMGPPIAAPGLMSIVGAMGLLAAVLRRENWNGRARRAVRARRPGAAHA